MSYEKDDEGIWINEGLRKFYRAPKNQEFEPPEDYINIGFVSWAKASSESEKLRKKGYIETYFREFDSTKNK